MAGVQRVLWSHRGRVARLLALVMVLYDEHNCWWLDDPRIDPALSESPMVQLVGLTDKTEDDFARIKDMHRWSARYDDERREGRHLRLVR